MPPLLLSTSADLSGAVPLDGVHVATGTGMYVLVAATGVTSVVFSAVNADTGATVVAARTESRAPLTLLADSSTGARTPWTPPAGRYTVTAKVTATDGTVGTTTATVTVDPAATTAPTATTPQVMMSRSADLSGAAALDGVHVTAGQGMYVLVAATGVTSVVFSAVNADTGATVVAARTESRAPLTLLADSSTGARTPWTPPAGRYTVTAKVTATDGTVGTTTATVTVDPAATTAPPVLLATAPPALTDPLTVTVPVTGGTVTMSQSRDYIVKFPSVPVTAGVTLSGGHNVVVVGGEIRSPGHGVLRINKNTGTVHVEGQVWGDPTTLSTEGCDIDAKYATPGSRIQFVNIRCRELSGSFSTNHADVLQCWAMAPGTQFVVERLDGTTDYQGLMWQPEMYGTQCDLLRITDTVLRRARSGGKLIYLTTTGAQTPRDWRNVKLVSTGLYEIYPNNILAAEPGVQIVTSAPSPLLGSPGVGYVSPGYSA